LNFGKQSLGSFGYYPRPRHHPTVSVVTDLAPGQFSHRLTWKKRYLSGRKPDANADVLPSPGQFARDDEFIVTEAAVRGLNDVLRDAEFFPGIGINAGVRSS
jgi:hypothetical protein